MKRGSRAGGELVSVLRRKAGTSEHGVRTKSVLHSSASVAALETEVARLARELEETLEQQTAIADLLSVISRSKFALKPVLQTVIDAAVQLCRATSGEIFRLDKGIYRFEVGCNLDPVNAGAGYDGWPDGPSVARWFGSTTF
jgi:hypothetical protein